MNKRRKFHLLLLKDYPLKENSQRKVVGLRRRRRRVNANISLMVEMLLKLGVIIIIMRVK